MEEKDYQELHELREQIGLLKEKLVRQQIISEQAIIGAAQKGISKLNRAGKSTIYLGLFAIVWCTLAFYNMGFSYAFIAFNAIFLAVCVAATIYAHWELMSVDIARGNLVEIAQKLIRFRKIYSKWHFFSVPGLLVWCYFMYRESLVIPEIADAFYIGATIGGVIGAIVGLKKYFTILREADKVLANINDLMKQE